MIWMILGFLFMYWFVIGLYYILKHNTHDLHNDIYQIEPIMSKPSYNNMTTLEQAGRIYSDAVNIPIFDGPRDSMETGGLEEEEPDVTKKCGICDRILPDDSKFCIYCGAKL